MKKVISISLPVILMMLVLTGCGSTKNDDGKTGKDSLAVKDSLRNTKEVFDPMAPPDADYSGDHIVKYQNGITQVRGFFRFGKRHGKWASFYPTGELWSETEYNNGVKTGKTTVWYTNGKVQYEGEFNNEQRTGTWKFYDSLGKVINEQKYDVVRNK